MKATKTNNEEKLKIEIKSYKTQLNRIKFRLNMLQKELDSIKKMCEEENETD